MKTLLSVAALIAASTGVALADDVAPAAPLAATPFHISSASAPLSPVTIEDYVLVQRASARTGVVEILTISLTGQPIEAAVQRL